MQWGSQPKGPKLVPCRGLHESLIYPDLLFTVSKFQTQSRNRYLATIMGAVVNRQCFR
jgi:hypothetical protein